MYVVDVTENNLAVLIVRTGAAVLEAATFQLVSSRIVYWSSIENLDHSISHGLLSTAAQSDIFEQVFISAVPSV